MTDKRKRDVEQERIISAPSDARIIVEAGPGYGKTDVACARVAELLKAGAPANSVLLLTFTRTAVREIRDRISALADAGVDVNGVEIRTLDSFAWRLRKGVIDPAARVRTAGYDESFELLHECLNSRLEDDRTRRLREYLGRKHHVLVDEAQDLVGIRATFVYSLLQSLPGTVGWTVFVDPAQAIYDWVESESGSAGESFLEYREKLAETARTERLTTLHRTADPRLRELLVRAREYVLDPDCEDRCDTLRELLFDDEAADQLDRNSVETHAAAAIEKGSRFVLFRQRGDALMLSNNLAGEGICHQLRLGHLARPVPPWIAAVSRQLQPDQWAQTEFTEVWHELSVRYPYIFNGWKAESAWQALRSVAADGRIRVKASRIADAIAQGYLPDELVRKEIGGSGPVIGTIHAAKGREADDVLLVVPGATSDAEDDQEARVIYVGVTRPKASLHVVQGTSRGIFSYREPDRAWRNTTSGKIQIEVGREGDVHPAGSVLAVPDPAATQDFLLRFDGRPLPVAAYKVKADPELRDRREGYRYNLQLAEDPKTPLSSLSKEFDEVCFEAGRKSWGRGPKYLRFAYLFDVRTSALSDGDAALARVPEPWRSRRLWLSPVITGLFLAFNPHK